MGANLGLRAALDNLCRGAGTYKDIRTCPDHVLGGKKGKLLFFKFFLTKFCDRLSSPEFVEIHSAASEKHIYLDAYNYCPCVINQSTTNPSDNPILF